MKLSQILLSAIAPILVLTTLGGCAVQGNAPRQAAASDNKTAAKPSSHTTASTPPKTLRVRTTAYTGKRNAIGKPLSHGPVISAASDWSRFPLGTRFKIRQTGKTYVIDDYGSALVGTNTIDLAKRSHGIVNSWGVRWVDIDILEWGSSRRSLEVLTPRERVRYVKPMVKALREQAVGIPNEFHRVPM